VLSKGQKVSHSNFISLIYYLAVLTLDQNRRRSSGTDCDEQETKCYQTDIMRSNGKSGPRSFLQAFFKIKKTPEVPWYNHHGTDMFSLMQTVTQVYTYIYTYTYELAIIQTASLRRTVNKIQVLYLYLAPCSIHSIPLQLLFYLFF
jgi:hypothetical protein